MDAFLETSLNLVQRVYSELSPSELSWSSGTAGVQLCNLVIDGTIRRGSIVVDLGCGQGTESTFLAVQGMKVIGIDIVSEALETAKKLSQHYGVSIQYVRGDILAIPLLSGCADVVNDSFIFHNIRDQARDNYAREVSRILQPNGLFILRGFSNKMDAGSGPRRLSSDEILTTFLPYFVCEHLSLFSGFPTEKRPKQLHWLALLRKRNDKKLV